MTLAGSTGQTPQTVAGDDVREVEPLRSIVAPSGPVPDRSQCPLTGLDDVADLEVDRRVERQEVNVNWYRTRTETVEVAE